MESPKPFEGQLQKLSALKTTVSEYAKCFLPSLINGGPKDLLFVDIYVDDYFGNEDNPTYAQEVGFVLSGHEGAGRPPVHLTTPWSRSQLLRHMGTKEKWFSSVPHAVQADEFNARRHLFDGQILKLMRDPMAKDSDVRVVRGLVSQYYKDIPNTLVMELLLESAGDCSASAAWSGISDRAFYCAMVVDQPLPGMFGESTMYPGAIIRNSEVGSTSLWVVPALHFPAFGVVVPAESLGTYRRAHRGKNLDIVGEFSSVIHNLSNLWLPVVEKLKQLESLGLPNELAALDLAEKVATGAPKYLIHRIKQIYKKHHHPKHNAAQVLDAALEACRDTLPTLDLKYVRGALAGSIMLHLIKCLP